jgi:hypothetical protein
MIATTKALSLTLTLAGIALVLFSVAGLAQEVYPVGVTGAQTYQQNRRDLLRQNASKLKVSISLDQQEYLPGEAAQVHISLTNPTPVPLEVYEPFKIETGAMVVYATKTVGGKTLIVSSGQICCSASPPDTMTRTLAASESVSGTFNSNEAHFNSAEPMAIIPYEPGNYRLAYTHGPGTSDFKVLQATVEGAVSVPLEKSGQTVSGGKTHAIPRRTMLILLKAGTIHYIVATSRSVFGFDFDARISHEIGQNLTYGTSREIAPFFRVASSEQPIVSLNGIANSQENITVAWATADGQQHTVSLGPDRKLRK